LPWLPGITIGAGIDEPCCAAAGANPPIAIASPITAAVSAEIKLRPVPGIVVVVIAMPALRRSDARSYLMILFAPALGKPVSFSGLLHSRYSHLLDEFAQAKFQRPRNLAGIKPYFAF
jgi:hypothetical protein